ncbi:hypothetical protein HDU84_007763 [Entophlyctis sp. JEL0112]|nr:hypothetical protein HDU84_007763 [Entophlyctis sp. JEL0112]
MVTTAFEGYSYLLLIDTTSSLGPIEMSEVGSAHSKVPMWSRTADTLKVQGRMTVSSTVRDDDFVSGNLSRPQYNLETSDDLGRLSPLSLDTKSGRHQRLSKGTTKSKIPSPNTIVTQEEDPSLYIIRSRTSSTVSSNISKFSARSKRRAKHAEITQTISKKFENGASVDASPSLCLDQTPVSARAKRRLEKDRPDSHLNSNVKTKGQSPLEQLQIKEENMNVSVETPSRTAQLYSPQKDETDVRQEKYAVDTSSEDGKMTAMAASPANRKQEMSAIMKFEIVEEDTTEIERKQEDYEVLEDWIVPSPSSDSENDYERISTRNRDNSHTSLNIVHQVLIDESGAVSISREDGDDFEDDFKVVHVDILDDSEDKKYKENDTIEYAEDQFDELTTEGKSSYESIFTHDMHPSNSVSGTNYKPEQEVKLASESSEFGSYEHTPKAAWKPNSAVSGIGFEYRAPRQRPVYDPVFIPKVYFFGQYLPKPVSAGRVAEYRRRSRGNWSSGESKFVSQRKQPAWAEQYRIPAAKSKKLPGAVAVKELDAKAEDCRDSAEELEIRINQIKLLHDTEKHATPTHIEAFIKLSRCWLKIGKYKEALRAAILAKSVTKKMIIQDNTKLFQRVTDAGSAKSMTTSNCTSYSLVMHKNYDQINAPIRDIEMATHLEAAIDQLINIIVNSRVRNVGIEGLVTSTNSDGNDYLALRITPEDDFRVLHSYVEFKPMKNTQSSGIPFHDERLDLWRKNHDRALQFCRELDVRMKHAMKAPSQKKNQGVSISIKSAKQNTTHAAMQPNASSAENRRELNGTATKSSMARNPEKLTSKSRIQKINTGKAEAPEGTCLGPVKEVAKKSQKASPKTEIVMHEQSDSQKGKADASSIMIAAEQIMTQQESGIGEEVDSLRSSDQPLSPKESIETKVLGTSELDDFFL